MRELLILSLIAIIAIPLGMAHAQTTYIINIPTGAADPNAPYFWQVESTGNTDGDLTIVKSNTVTWENADTAAHTVTSGTAEEGPNGIFDSSLFPPGQSFSHTFNEIGTYDYFCLVHPWMTGTITVTTGLRTLSNVGENVGDGMTTFDIEYQFNRVISTATVNENSKSVTFQIVGNTNSDDNTLTLKLPNGLISGVSAVSVDGSPTEYDLSMEGDLSVVTVSTLKPTSKTVTVTGASVVPEFGTIVSVALAISIIAVIAVTSKTQKFGIPKL